MELLAAAAILALSVSCGLAVTRLLLEVVFSYRPFTTRTAALPDAASVSLAMDLAPERELGLATPA
jgi:hypothetical protein